MEPVLKLPKLDIDQKKYQRYPEVSVDTQFETVPDEIIFCKKCVISNQRPRTEFDADGICSACRYAEKKFSNGIDWAARERELRALLDMHRSKDGSFDCLVPSSGGKDSAVVIHQLKHRYGMHPLAITWAPFIYTDIGWQNYLNTIQSGFDGLVAWPNGLVHRKLARVAFELKGDAFEPFVYGQKSFAFHAALRFKIPLIFYGENGEVEYGGSMRNVDKPFESVEDWESLYFKGSGIDTLAAKGKEMGILSEADVKENSFQFYKAPPLAEIKQLNVQMHWWSYYHLWVPQENYYYAAKHTGLKTNPEGRTGGTYTKGFSIDDKLDPFHYYLMLIKLGHGRASREASSDVRCGHLTRDEAVALVKRYDQDFPKTYFKDFLKYLDIDETHFWKIIDHYRRPNVWKKINDEWKLRHTVAKDGIDD